LYLHFSPWAISRKQSARGWSARDRFQTMLGGPARARLCHGGDHRKVQRPTLVIAHNKTLAAQLY
jgi:excinuclease UvrABC helicase subunit UvrB